MADRAREQLLGYLLGALEETERESVENQLEQNPKLFRDLALTRESLKPLWMMQPDFDPPPGLAARTCELIAASTKTWINSTPDPAKKPARKVPPRTEAIPAAGSTEGGSYSSWLDLAVAVGIVAAMSLLALPAIQNSRFNSRLAACKDHLRQLGLALTQYSETHDDYFPPVYDRGHRAGAGSYASVLVTDEFVDGSHWFVCPASPLAEDRDFRVPLLSELESASPEQLARWRASMGGSFGYNLGFLENGRYYGPRNLRRPYFALMADAPSSVLPGYQSINHGGRGQNVLLEDGHVLFYATPRPHVRADDVFVNELGMVDAGKHRNDSVIGSSASVPSLPCGLDR